MTDLDWLEDDEHYTLTKDEAEQIAELLEVANEQRAMPDVNQDVACFMWAERLREGSWS